MRYAQVIRRLNWLLMLEPTRSFHFARKVNYVRAKPLPLGKTMIFVNALRKALAGP